MAQATAPLTRREIFKGALALGAIAYLDRLPTPPASPTWVPAGNEYFLVELIDEEIYAARVAPYWPEFLNEFTEAARDVFVRSNVRPGPINVEVHYSVEEVAWIASATTVST